MRILLVSDLHYSLPQFDWVVHAGADVRPRRAGRRPPRHRVVGAARRAERGGAAVPAAAARDGPRGGELGQPRPHRPRRRGRAGGAVAGRRPRAGRADRRRLAALGDTLVTDLPVVGRPGGHGRRRAAADRRRRAGVRRAGSGCTTGRRSARRRAGRAGATTATPTSAGWIDRFRPDIVLTGHVHEPPFKPDGAWADRIGDTWVFNAGRQIGPVPAHIEIDLAASARPAGGRCRRRGDRPHPAVGAASATVV